MFDLISNGDLKYYTSPLLEGTGAVWHGFSTRAGGVSKGCYSTMNLRSHSGDDWGNVTENFGRITAALGMERGRLVLSKQVHEAEVVSVTEKDAGNGILYENKFKSADALVTDVKGLPIAVFSADCVPVLLLDARRKTAAAVHSGWRGTVKRIAQRAAEKMKNDYGCDPRDIVAAIGPSIQEECFEVGDDVARIFAEEFGADTAVKYGGRYHVNMQRAIIKQLRESGIEQIDDCGICTACNTELLYSHRKMGNERGNQGAFIELI